MIDGLKVISPGIYSSIQDLGRYGHRKEGVPLSGAMDQLSFKRANALLNNEINAPAIEMVSTGAKFTFLNTTVAVITGADFNPTLNNQSLAINKIFSVAQGDELAFNQIGFGNIAYLAVFGGFICERVLESCSQYEGITALARLSKSKVLNFNTIDHLFISPNTRIRTDESHFTNQLIPVLKGPEFHCLPKKVTEHFFTISSKSNRMAIQFNEAIELHKKPIEMLTSAVMPGTIQMTPSGQLIVLMRDGQTTGGYPRVLQLPENSINQLVQKRIGEKIRLVLID